MVRLTSTEHLYLKIGLKNTVYDPSPTGASNHDLFCVCLPSCSKNEALEAATKTLRAEGIQAVGLGRGEATCVRQ
jgi:hypothetical protein